MDQYQHYYLYGHHDPRSGVLMYIGVGQKTRAWELRASQRSAEHHAWVEELYGLGFTPDEFVTIHRRGLSKQEALEFESKLIETQQPRFNKHGTLAWSYPTKYTQELCDWAAELYSMGYSFKNVAFLLGAANPINSAMTTRRMVLRGNV